MSDINFRDIFIRTIIFAFIALGAKLMLGWTPPAAHSAEVRTINELLGKPANPKVRENARIEEVIQANKNMQLQISMNDSLNKFKRHNCEQAQRLGGQVRYYPNGSCDIITNTAVPLVNVMPVYTFIPRY